MITGLVQGKSIDLLVSDMRVSILGKNGKHALEIVMRQTELMSENIAYEKAKEDMYKKPAFSDMVADESEGYSLV